MKKRIITIDGPAASGKSTLAREVAKRLNCVYVDSGAFYRAVTWMILKKGISVKNHAQVMVVLLKSKWTFEVRDGAVVFFIDGIEPSPEVLRTKEVREAVSDIAAIPAVRVFVVNRLRKLKKLGSISMEGRDIGSVVFPKTPYKFYLDATPEERARRRHAELIVKGETEKTKDVLIALQQRDQKDSSRKAAPLKIATGAYMIDTSKQSVDMVARTLLNRIVNLETPRTKTYASPTWYRVVCEAFGIGLAICSPVTAYGLQNVPKTGGVIIASNHASYLDPPSIGFSCRRRTIHFMARDTLFKNWCLGFIFRKVGVIQLNRKRGDLKAMKTAISLLRDGAAVTLFPEGARSLNGELQPPKSGVGFLVAKGQAPVVPVYVHGSFDAWPKQGKLKRKPISVVYGQLITIEEIQCLGSGHEAYALIGELIMRRIAELKEKFEKGFIHE